MKLYVDITRSNLENKSTRESLLLFSNFELISEKYAINAGTVITVQYIPYTIIKYESYEWRWNSSHALTKREITISKFWKTKYADKYSYVFIPTIQQNYYYSTTFFNCIKL